MNFPSISTGAYRFPVDRAARIALHEIFDFLKENSGIDEVLIVCYDEKTKKIYDEAYMEIYQTSADRTVK